MLEWYAAGRLDAQIGIDEEKDEDFAVSGFTAVNKAERGDLVLVDVWETDRPVLLGYDAANFLRTVIIPAIDVL